MTSCRGATGQTGTVYTYAQLEGLWINAGGPKAVAPIAAAIAEAESGGCSAAVNPVDNNGRQTSWGLWQISNGTHAQPVPNILSAGTNAAAAVTKYQGANDSFAPWGTYNSGAYKAFVNGGTTPDTNVPYGTATGTGSQAGTVGSGCLINNPFSASLPLIGNITAGPSCIFSKSQARALIGGGLLVMSAGGLLVGLLVLAAAGFRASGAGHAAGGALETVGAGVAFVPGGQAAGLAIGAAGAKARRADSVSSAGRQSLERRRARRQPQTEAVTVTDRTPIEGEMGGTRITRRTYRQPRQLPA